MPTQQLPLVSPIKGVVRAVSREGQPPETCWDAQNCLPYDRYGRKRLAQRPGLAKEYPTQMSDNFVQGLLEAPSIIYPPGTIPANYGTPIAVPVVLTPEGPDTVPYIGPDIDTLPGGATWVWTFNWTPEVDLTYTAEDGSVGIAGYITASWTFQPYFAGDDVDYIVLNLGTTIQMQQVSPGSFIQNSASVSATGPGGSVNATSTDAAIDYAAPCTSVTQTSLITITMTAAGIVTVTCGAGTLASINVGQAIDVFPTPNFVPNIIGPTYPGQTDCDITTVQATLSDAS